MHREAIFPLRCRPMPSPTFHHSLKKIGAHATSKSTTRRLGRGEYDDVRKEDGTLSRVSQVHDVGDEHDVYGRRAFEE